MVGSTTHDRLTQGIVSKLWNLWNVLKDDGVTDHQDARELTDQLVLKMAKGFASDRFSLLHQ